MNIKQVLREKEFRFNRQFGQNFLTDEVLLKQIVDDADVVGKTVLEVGAGAGTLTRVLSQSAARVVAFEIDRNLRSVLNVTLADCKNVDVVIGDVMKYKVPQLEEMCGGAYCVVANIPYYITTPLLMRFVEEGANVLSLTLTVQKEVAERLAANPATKEYGAITVAVNAVADVKVTRSLSRELFFPVPDVDSAVVRIVINRNKFRSSLPANFRKTVRAAFAMRRKTLANNIAVGFGISREEAAEILRRRGLSANCRGEELDVEQFVALAEELCVYDK